MAHDLARSALWYARHGWRVFPIHTGRKKPAVNAWPKVATNDPDIVANWWRWDMNIGLACGAASGVYVIDIDSRDGVDGEAALTKLAAKLGPLPVTVEQRSGSGGRHLFFKYPDGRDMRNVVGGKHGNKAFPAGIDARGNGGATTLAPSVHPCGERYRWIRGPHEQALAEMPLLWALKFQKPQEVRVTLPIVPLRKCQVWRDERMQRWWNEVATCPKGSRNAILFGRTKDAAKLTLVAGGSLSSVKTDMEAAGKAAGLDDVETRITVASALDSVRRRG